MVWFIILVEAVMQRLWCASGGRHHPDLHLNSLSETCFWQHIWKVTAQAYRWRVEEKSVHGWHGFICPWGVKDQAGEEHPELQTVGICPQVPVGWGFKWLRYRGGAIWWPAVTRGHWLAVSAPGSQIKQSGVFGSYGVSGCLYIRWSMGLSPSRTKWEVGEGRGWRGGSLAADLRPQ